MKIVVRLMQEADVPQLVSIENRWSYLSKWGAEGYLRVLRDSRVYRGLVAEDLEPETDHTRPILAGFAVLALLIDHSELCNLVAPPEYLSKKVGYRLMQDCLALSRHQGIFRMYLEVRTSNLRAIDFYRRNGFQIISRRKHYYLNPPEDAWVMERIESGMAESEKLCPRLPE